jgi:hypothetical protein
MVILPVLMIPLGNMTARRMRAIRNAFKVQTATSAQMLGMCARLF